MKKGLIFIISGPSGSGKTTLLRNLLKEKKLAQKLARPVSLTTRPKRSGEKNGQDYFFVSKEEFLYWRRQKKLLEWTQYLGYYYATPKDFVDLKRQKGRHLILCLDVKGAKRIRRLYPKKSVTIFIKPPSLKELENRITRRGCRTKKEELKERLYLAREELRASRLYDYRLLNADLKQVTAKLKEIILKKMQRS